jgi:hypothetical protein
MTLLAKIIHKVEEQVEKKTHSGHGQQNYGPPPSYNQQSYGQQNYVHLYPLSFKFVFLILPRTALHPNNTTTDLNSAVF